MKITPKIKLIYASIQKKLFYIIPEKWDKIFLYASIIEQPNQIQAGEMFFYYFPKGILKKNPVNVYEIPNRFNIDEQTYLKLVEELYDEIKVLRQEMLVLREKEWSNVTISIENFKFQAEFSYENLLNYPFSSYERHIIWRYQYLKIPIEACTKQEQNILNDYLRSSFIRDCQTNIYSESFYKNAIHNVIQYDKQEYIKEDWLPLKQEIKEKEEILENRNQILNFKT